MKPLIQAQHSGGLSSFLVQQKHEENGYNPLARSPVPTAQRPRDGPGTALLPATQPQSSLRSSQRSLFR